MLFLSKGFSESLDPQADVMVAASPLGPAMDKASIGETRFLLRVAVKRAIPSSGSHPLSASTWGTMLPPQVKEMTDHGNWDRHDSSLETDGEGQTREVAYTPLLPPTTYILREKETPGRRMVLPKEPVLPE